MREGLHVKLKKDKIKISVVSKPEESEKLRQYFSDENNLISLAEFIFDQGLRKKTIKGFLG